MRDNSRKLTVRSLGHQKEHKKALREARYIANGAPNAHQEGSQEKSS